HHLSDWRRSMGSTCLRQIAVDGLLRKRQRGHEDHEKHQQDVDQGRDVHLGAWVGTLRTDDFCGTNTGVGARHRDTPCCELDPDAKQKGPSRKTALGVSCECFLSEAQLPAPAPAAFRIPSVTMPTFSTPAPLAASITSTMSL